MSIEENKAVERRVFEEVINKKDLALVDELFASNYVFHGVGGVELKGPEGFKQYSIMIFTAFPDSHATIEDMVAEGDRVACRYTVSGTHKGDFMGIAPTGKQVKVTAILITRFEGGKKAETWDIQDQLGMMQQMGVVLAP